MTGFANLASLWRAVRGPGTGFRFADSTFVPRTSVARLHACERVIPLAKRTAVPLDPKRASLRRLQAELTRRVAKFLATRVDSIATQIGFDLDTRGLRKANLPHDELSALEAIVAGIDFAGWSVLVGDIEELLADIVRDGMVASFGQIGFGTEARKEVVNVVAAEAVEYGRQRSAALVGMRVDALGSVIPNPRARWRITEGTREYLRATVREAIAEGWSNDTIAAKLRTSYGFSKSRAMLIARTETNMASNAGALASYKASGVVGGKQWLTAEDDKVTPDCVLNGDAGTVALASPFPSGAEAPPDHPNCRCTLVPVVDWTMVDNIPSALTESP